MCGRQCGCAVGEVSGFFLSVSFQFCRKVRDEPSIFLNFTVCFVPTGNIQNDDNDSSPGNINEKAKLPES